MCMKNGRKKAATENVKNVSNTVHLIAFSTHETKYYKDYAFSDVQNHLGKMSTGNVNKSLKKK